MGILPTFQAIKKAEEYGLDLVEVSPTAKPPVCRVMDFGKYKYEQAKKQHSVRSHQRSMQLKEVKLRPYTTKHDLEIKVRNVRRFLEERNKAKVTLTFRGRERAHTAIAKTIMEVFLEGTKDVGVIEAPMKMEGDHMVMILGPKPEAVKGKKQQSQPVHTTVHAPANTAVKTADDKAVSKDNINIEGRENEQDKA